MCNHNRNFRANAITLALSVATPTLAATASAQDTSSRATTLEEVIVTAQRREESLQDTPIAVTAFTADKLADLGVYDVSEIGSYAPNVSIQKQPSSNGNMGIFIRGIGIGETSLLADPKVGFYLDGVFLGKSVGAVFDIVDLERIEVLRGPQGTLFGRNTTGGAMNVTTVKPSGEFHVKAEASMGRFGSSRFGATVDLPAFGPVAAKVSAVKTDTDGWADNDFPGSESDLASEDNKAYRIALTWQAADSLTIDYSYDKTDNEGAPAPFQITKVKDSIYNGISTTPTDFQLLGGELYQQMAATIGDPQDRRTQYNLDAVSDELLEVDGHNLTVAWELGDITLKYIGAYRETDQTYDSTDLDGGAYIVPDLFYGGGAPVLTPGFIAAIPTGELEQTSHEFQIIGSAFDDKLYFTGGLFLYDQEVNQENPQTFALPINFVLGADGTGSPLFAGYEEAGLCVDVGGGQAFCQGSQRLPLPFGAPGADPNLNGMVDFIYGQESESWAVYGQATYSLTEQADLTLGLRYTEDEKDAFLFNENIGHVARADQLTGDESWDNLSYLVNLSYRIGSDASIYAKYSTGYNGGGFNARALTDAAFTTPYEEEEVESYEVGLKSEWFDNRLRFNVAAFFNSYTDIQLAQFEAGSGGASSTIVNAGEGTYQGVEFDIVAVPLDGLTLDLTYGYLDAEFDEYLARDPATDMEIDISDAATVTHAPKHTLAFGAQYDFEPFAFGVLSARLDVQYKDEFVFHAFQNQFDAADDRTMINGRLSLNEISLGDTSKLRVSVWGKNLSDEEYRNWGIDFGSLGYAGAVFGEPRSYGIDVVYNFN